MKKLIILPIVAMLSVGAFGASTKTTTTKTYSETDSPALNSNIEQEEYDQPMSPDSVDRTRMEEQQKMEERNNNSSSIMESNDSIDYKDRTRTNRERKAINTGSDASDDQ